MREIPGLVAKMTPAMKELLPVLEKVAQTGKPLLIVGNEVSGTTAVLQLNLKY